MDPLMSLVWIGYKKFSTFEIYFNHQKCANTIGFLTRCFFYFSNWPDSVRERTEANTSRILRQLGPV